MNLALRFKSFSKDWTTKIMPILQISAADPKKPMPGKEIGI
jgi:hypothetical protein